MPRMISFSMTTPQFIDGSKTVTRRMNWLNAKAGQELMAVEKAMGLGKGGTVKRLGLIRLVDVRREPLRRMFDEPDYGKVELIYEGFPLMTVKGFIEMFCLSHKGCEPESLVTRIVFVKL